MCVIRATFNKLVYIYNIYIKIHTMIIYIYQHVYTLQPGGSKVLSTWKKATGLTCAVRRGHD